MYGGDEVAALVIEIGSANAKAGYAGEETPKSVFPSLVGVSIAAPSSKVGAGGAVVGEETDKDKEKQIYVGTNSLAFRRDAMEISSPLRNGIVDKWEEYESLISFAVKHQLTADFTEHPVLLAEPSFNNRAAREKATELFFEKYRTPAMFVAKNAVLSSFASGKATSMVVDCGAAISVVCAVHDGYALQKSIFRNSIAGDRINEELLKFFRNKNIDIQAPYTIAKKEVDRGKIEVTFKDYPRTTESYRNYQIYSIMRDIKETTCKISEGSFQESQYANVPSMAYELPDGKMLELGTERYRIPELLFDTDSLTDAKENPGLGHLTLSSFKATDTDLRRELLNNVVVAGGSSLYTGFVERLQNEMVAVNMRIRVIAANITQERKFSTWIGGSILASLGSFQQMWMSKQEYEEHGRSLVERKCP